MHNIFFIILLLFIFYATTIITNILIRNLSFGYFTKILLSLIVGYTSVIIFLLKYNIVNKDYLAIFLFLILLNSYIYMNIIQIIVSSIRVNILKLFYKKKKNKIKKLFNDERLFEKRINRLNSASIIVLKKKYVLLNSKKILIILFFYVLVKKIYNIKKIYY